MESHGSPITRVGFWLMGLISPIFREAISDPLGHKFSIEKHVFSVMIFIVIMLCPSCLTTGGYCVCSMVTQKVKLSSCFCSSLRFLFSTQSRICMVWVMILSSMLPSSEVKQLFGKYSSCGLVQCAAGSAAS